LFVSWFFVVVVIFYFWQHRKLVNIITILLGSHEFRYNSRYVQSQEYNFLPVEGIL